VWDANGGSPEKEEPKVLTVERGRTEGNRREEQVRRKN